MLGCKLLYFKFYSYMSRMENTFDNLCPISNLGYISKLLEQFTIKHTILIFFDGVFKQFCNRLIPAIPFQAPRLRCLKYWIEHEQSAYLFVILDLSSAFVLLTIKLWLCNERLSSKFAFRCKVLNRLSSYFSVRSYRVMLNAASLIFNL